MGDNITRVVEETTMVMHILARVYKYRVNSSLRWTEEILEDFVARLGKETKDRIKEALAEANHGYCGGKKHLLRMKNKSSD